MEFKRYGMIAARLALRLGCCLFFIVSGIAGIQASQPSGEGQSIYQTLSRTVIRFEQLVYDGANATTIRSAHGTGFFVAFEKGLFLVSAHHVSARGLELCVRIPAYLNNTREIHVRELSVPAKAWVAHPSHHKPLAVKTSGRSLAVNVKAVDVVVAHVSEPPGFQLAPIRYCRAPCPHRGVNQFADTDPEPPEAILVFGYPRFLGAEPVAQRPLARAGVVVMTSKEPFLRYSHSDSFAEPRMLALDVRSFDGNSGSPVFRRAGFGSRPILVGMVSAGIHEFDLTYAEPVSRIKETIEWAHTHKPSEQAEWLLPQNTSRGGGR